MKKVYQRWIWIGLLFGVIYLIAFSPIGVKWQKSITHSLLIEEEVQEIGKEWKIHEGEFDTFITLPSEWIEVTSGVFRNEGEGQEELFVSVNEIKTLADDEITRLYKAGKIMGAELIVAGGLCEDDTNCGEFILTQEYKEGIEYAIIPVDVEPDDQVRITRSVIINNVLFRFWMDFEHQNYDERLKLFRSITDSLGIR